MPHKCQCRLNPRPIVGNLVFCVLQRYIYPDKSVINLHFKAVKIAAFADKSLK